MREWFSLRRVSMGMLRFYIRLARQVPELIRKSTSRATKLTAGFLALLTTVGPWLAQLGHGEIADLASALPRWWAPAWAAFFVALGLLKLNYALHSSTETERDALKARLEDRRERQADADELGRMRKTMRKRLYMWLERNRQTKEPTYPDGEALAFTHQGEIAKLLEERYGYHVTDFFLTAKNSDSTNPMGLLLPTEEYSARIERLGVIIDRVHRGQYRRRVF
jgi:hypothetical protein